MVTLFKKQRLAVITLAFWFLLLFIIAAWIWWYISLRQQNDDRYRYELLQLDKNSATYQIRLGQISEEHDLKTAQFISEGITFLLVTLVGAVFVYRATRKQILLSRQQQNFMMAVTHELKTPISVAKLNLETLQKRKLEESQRERLIANTLEETNRLNELTNNILVASQLDTGVYGMHKQQLNFSKLVLTSVSSFMLRFPNREFQAGIAEDVYLQGEEMLLQLLVNNLLDNASKYSPRELPVRINLVKSENEVILSVTDQGAGIPDAEKLKIFEKFYRSGNESTRSAKGTGLGLYLCKKIVADHKGSILVTDNQPKGSIFTVRFRVGG